MKVRFKTYDCSLVKTSYRDGGRIALQLVDDEGPVATCTTNLPDLSCPPGHTFLKTWSENRGMLEALVSAGAVEDTGVRVPTGYVEAALVKVLI